MFVYFRVLYRKEMLVRKLQEKKEEYERELQEDMERERRLQALRDTVSVEC